MPDDVVRDPRRVAPLHPDAGAESTARAVLGGVLGGFVGTSLMTLVLFVINAIYGGRLEVFRQLSELAGGGENVFLGFLLFFAAGSLAWPLLFVTAGIFLPGGTRPRQGVVFALLLWVGFALAFGGRYDGTDLLVFVAFSLTTHLVYGYVVGFVLARFTGHIVGPEARV